MGEATGHRELAFAITLKSEIAFYGLDTDFSMNRVSQTKDMF